LNYGGGEKSARAGRGHSPRDETKILDGLGDPVAGTADANRVFSADRYRCYFLQRALRVKQRSLSYLFALRLRAIKRSGSAGF
jgi:hypothetical protein